MPYAFYHDHNFSVVDSTTKNGVFYQFFSSSYSPKPIPIQFQGTKEYSAHMSPDGRLYVAAMPDAFHLNYYTLENNRFIKNSLVSNKVSNYHLSTPMIYTLHNQPFIIYLSNQLHSNTYNFVHENLSQPNLTTLLTLYTQPEQIKYYLSSNVLYIFYVTFDEVYHLNALCISSDRSWVNSYIQSSFPIADYSICIDDDTIHIVYAAELHGKYQLIYCNPTANLVTPLMTTQYPSNPSVFIYYHALWINALIDHKLHMMISMDEGQTFSIPVLCSIQNNIHRCHVLIQKSSSLTANELYLSLGPNIKLCTIAMIDFEHFHSDSFIPPELELLLEGLLLLASSAASTPDAQSNEFSETNSHTSNLSRTGDSPKAPASPSKSVEKAKNDFMEQDLNGWDLPPLI